MAAPPDIRSYPHRKPDLSPLPPRVASRIEDMWRVGRILSGHFYLRDERDQLRKGISELDAVFTRHVHSHPFDPGTADDAFQAVREKYRIARIHGDPEGEERKKAPFAVNTWVSATHDECNRLAAEAQLVFFQMAMDTLPDKTAIGKALPLIDCLRRLRNASVHHKPLGVASDEFSGELSYDDPTVPGIKFLEADAWFLDVKPDDLNYSFGGPVAPEVGEWFCRQADRWPLNSLLTAAVFQLCGYFSRGTGGKK